MASSKPLGGEFDPRQANALLDEVHRQPTIAKIAQAARVLGPHRSALATAPVRVACLSSFTFDPLKSALELQGLRAGFAFDVHIGPYGQFDRELIDPASGTTAFKPDVVLLAVRLHDVSPAIYDGFNSLSSVEAEQRIDDWMARLRSALTTFRQHSAATVLLQNYEVPAWPALGIAGAAAPLSQAALIERAGQALRELASSMENVYVMDYDALVARHGRARWTDRRMALYARIPVSAENYWALAGFYVQHLRPLYGLSKKVLVLDADNTLWGGVVGDVGMEGIALGPDYPGSAYVAMQRRALELYHRGIVLCIASKNEPGSVEEVLDRHPEMVLRREHFSAMRINWRSKPENLQDMAAELNLGIDSFVFVDDSPVECDLVRTTLPSVLTVALPAEPAEYAAAIEALDCFEQWSISAEDRQRGALYRAEAGRRSLQTAAVDMPTFYRQLEMEMTLGVNEPAAVSRAAQMTQRTNQFNMHTIRCSEDDIRRFMASGDSLVVTLALKDRFGDNGTVGLAVVRRGRDEWVLHLLLMSCRILGRTVEQAFVDWIAARASASGASKLVGEFVPTKKNAPFAGFYGSCGFAAGPAEGTLQRWMKPLDGRSPTLPDWLKITVNNADESR
ncbi:MAG TPA: HAD-IIIC family phosphatase [Phycisphaerae bacterium]|nr:HAD-IIIC family phosphatase [Phycisphaerae bacterium]